MGCVFHLMFLDLGELVHWFEEDHDTHELTSSRRPRSYVGRDFKSVVVITWGKANFVILDFSVIGFDNLVG